jgi:hypothetical protein
MASADGGIEEPGGDSLGLPAPSVTVLLIWIMCPHLRHFIRTERPATFSSEIWYLALQLGQRNFIQLSAELDLKGQWTKKITRDRDKREGSFTGGSKEIQKVFFDGLPGGLVRGQP